MKKKKDQSLAIKERLVCDIINYIEVIHEEFEESVFFRKSALMLILFYLHLKGTALRDLEFLYSVLWEIKGKDLLIIKQDFLFIQNKIKEGKAHLLSEGDTVYLGACRKGQKGDKLRRQPNSTILAPNRAFSLKPAYMRTILDFVRAQKSNMATNTNIGLEEGPELVSLEELKHRGFEQIIRDRFVPYIGKDYKEIAHLLNIKVSPTCKSKNAVVANRILTQSETNYESFDEIKKSGIKLKTIRIEPNGRVKEDMSFENIDYSEVNDTTNWEDSEWYNIITTRYVFVIFRGVSSNDDHSSIRYLLDKMFFWTMPLRDYAEAKEYWDNIKLNVTNDTLLDACTDSPSDKQNTFWKVRDHKHFHVRPKGKNKEDKTFSPKSGIKVPKKCYWFSKSYLEKEIKDTYGDSWESIFEQKN